MRFATLFLLSLALLAPPAKAQVVAMEDAYPASVRSAVGLRASGYYNWGIPMGYAESGDEFAANYIADAGASIIGDADNLDDPMSDYAEYGYNAFAIAGAATSIPNQGGANFSGIQEWGCHHSAQSVSGGSGGSLEAYLYTDFDRYMHITSPDEYFDAEDELPMLTSLYILSGWVVTGDDPESSWIQSTGEMEYQGGDLDVMFMIDSDMIFVSFSHTEESDTLEVPYDPEFDEVTVDFIHIGNVDATVWMRGHHQTNINSGVYDDEEQTITGMVNYGVITVIVP